jgi:ATP-dependent DNA ligase
VLDGEIIMPTEEGLDFDSLQLRLHPAKSRVERLSAEIPTSFVAFDVLARGSTDLRPVPLHERLETLDELLAGHLAPNASDPATMPATKLFGTQRTTDPDTAARWFDELEKVRLDGIIAKRPGDSYEEGKRGWIKIKHRRTAECVVGGYRLHKNGGVGSLLLGLYEDGELGYVGHTSSFKASERKEIERLLEPLRSEKSFSGDWGPGGESRWQAGKDTDWVAIEPVLVCEVSYDFIQSGYRFRHAATFIAWRDDKRPEDCTFDQVRT